jgi:hypothetical protein
MSVPEEVFIRNLPYIKSNIFHIDSRHVSGQGASADVLEVKQRTDGRYNIKIPRTYKKVKGIKVLDAHIQSGQWLVDDHNKTFYFQDDSTDTATVQTVTLSEGDYATAAALATELQTQMSAESAASFTVSANASTDYLTITRSAADWIYLGIRSGIAANTLLGFTSLDTTSSSSIITAPNRPLIYPSSRMELWTDLPIETIHSKHNGGSVLCTLKLDEQASTWVYTEPVPNDVIPLHSGSLNFGGSFHIDIRNPDGSQYTDNGFPWSLTLELFFDE